MDENWGKDPASLTGFFMPNPLRSVPTKKGLSARLKDLPVGFWDF